jgi:hypothetical protein
MSLLALLILVLVVAVVIWATGRLIAAFAIPDPIATVLWVAVVVICLVYVLTNAHLVPVGLLGR